MTSKQKVATAAVAAVLVAGLGIGGAYAATEGYRVGEAEPAATTSAVTQASGEAEGTHVVQVGVTAEGYDPDSSSPVIAHVTNDDGTVDFYHAFDANVGEAVEVGGAGGEYEVSYITPVNSDGSLYEVGDAVKVTAESTDEGDGATPGEDEAATTTAATASAAKDSATATAATFKRVDAKDVTTDQLTKVAEQVAEAVKGGDSTLAGDAGAAVAKKVTENAKANPNADTAKVEETTAAAQESAKADESGASSANKSTSTTTKASSSSGSSSGNSSSSSSGSSSNSSSGNQQASTPQRKWVAEQGHWETTYEQVWVSKMVETRHTCWECSQCGATFDSDAGIDDHVWSTYKSETHPNGASAIDQSYSTYEDQGHYESQATGQTWVVDVPGHWE